MRLVVTLVLFGCLAACSGGSVDNRTLSTVANGRGAANTGILNGNNMPQPGGGQTGK
jgi:hypothetical protein